jgi:hypothetical protein
MPTPRAGNESHHGVMSRWMETHFPTYNPDNAPAVLMPAENHAATKGIYNTWRAAMRRKMGGTFEWSKVTKGDILELSEKMFDAANIPAAIRKQYYAALEAFLNSL